MIVILGILLIAAGGIQAQAPRGWYLATATAPQCSLNYEPGPMGPGLISQPPDTLINTWILGDDRSAPLVTQSKDIQNKLIDFATNKKVDDLKNLFAASFVQHSPMKEDGPDAMAAYLTSMDWGSGGREKLVEIYEGPMTMTLSRMKMGADTWAVVDFYVQGRSRYYEHWDAMRMSPGPNQSGRTLFEVSMPNQATTYEQRSKNKELVVNAINDYRNLKYAGAVQQFFAEDFIEHSVGGKDGQAPLTESLATLGDMRVDIKMVMADMDLVGVLSLLTVTMDKEMRSYVYVDLYRVRDCKLKEHWGFGERIPAKESFKHRNGAL